MTIPVIEEVQQSEGVGTSTTFSYPSTVNANDLIIGVFANDGSGDQSTFPTGDWADNELYNQNQSHGGAVSYIQAVGDEDGGSITMTHPSEDTNGIMIRISAWDTATPPEVSARGTSNDDEWDALTITPSWDSSTLDTLWLFVLTHDNGGVTVNAFPTEFPDNQNSYAPAGGGEDPGVHFATDDTLTATKTVAETVDDDPLSGGAAKITAIIAVKGSVEGTSSSAGLTLLGVGS